MCVQAATHFIPASRRPLTRVVALRNSVSVFPSGRALAANGRIPSQFARARVDWCAQAHGKPEGKKQTKGGSPPFFVARANVRPLEEVHSPQVIGGVFLLI